MPGLPARNGSEPRSPTPRSLPPKPRTPTSPPRTSSCAPVAATRRPVTAAGHSILTADNGPGGDYFTRQNPTGSPDGCCTFTLINGVEPTNPAERALRGPVIHRKLSLGTQSQRGERFAERALSAATTCRLQSRSLFTYLSDLITAHNRGDPFTALASPPGTERLHSSRLLDDVRDRRVSHNASPSRPDQVAVYPLVEAGLKPVEPDALPHV